jgi:hypothetical protein
VSTLADYRAAAERERTKLTVKLADGRTGPAEIAIVRVACDRMIELINIAPGSVLVYEQIGPDKLGFAGPDRFVMDAIKKAGDTVFPHEGSPEEVVRKYQEYLDLSLEMVRWGQVRQELIVDKVRGRQYLILGANPLVSKIMFVLSRALMDWAGEQPETRAFLLLPARAGLAEVLFQRPDMVALLRMAMLLPPDVEISDVPVDRPGSIEAIELAIALIPIIGSCVAAYEAWSGQDLFGYHLSDLERGILAASVLLPVAGRLAKGGRALYTEARLVSMYGRDAAAWSRAVRAGERGVAQREALLSLGKAERELRVTRSVGAAAADEARAAIPAVVRGSTPAAVVDVAVTDLLRELAQAHSALKQLDAFALERVLAKGPNVSHLKGQLLEELVESRVVPWLSSREGSFALGIAVPVGKKLEFIPGHLIRDLSGRQITDGILCFRDGEKLVIAGVFEAKAGKHAARELSFARDSLSGLTKEEVAELRANAKDVLLEQRAAAKAAKQPFNKTLDDIMKEYAVSERGGQVRRDIERLASGSTGPTKVRVGTQEIEVVFSPTRTKFFGVIPKGVRSATIEAQLAAEKVTFEILGVDLTSSQLDDIAKKLVKPAEERAAAAL